jgi:hypothetical protein
LVFNLNKYREIQDIYYKKEERNLKIAIKKESKKYNGCKNII